MGLLNMKVARMQAVGVPKVRLKMMQRLNIND
jgi:hypothetical protein